MANISEEWNRSIEDQGNAEAEATFAENQRTYDGYRSLVEQDRMARAQRKRAADNALASMLIEARNSDNGMVPASMCAAVSQDCGMDIAGGVLTKDGNFHLLTHDANGGIVEFPNGSGVINPGNQFGVLQRTGLGKDLQKELFNGFRKKYTASQLAKIGIKQPVDTLKREGVVEVGGTATFKGADTRPRGVHAFSSDGKGGFSSSDWTPEGGETRRDWGTRDPNYKGRWKVRVNGPDGKVYENDKTGEEITVKPGENLRDVLANSDAGEKERIAQINKESRLMEGEQAIERAKISADATKYKADKGLEGKKVYSNKTGDAKKVDSERKQLTKDQIAAMKGMLELAYASGMSEEEIKSLNSKIQKRISEDGVETGGESGGETSGDGGTETQKSDNISDVAKAKMMKHPVGQTFTYKGQLYVRTKDGIEPVSK